LHKIFRHIKKHKYGWAALLVFAIWFYNALPDPLFQPNYSTVLLSQNNELLGAQIAPDGQWRFAPSDSVPKKFKQCLVQFEDAYFYRHPGVNPISLAKAVYQDVKAQKIVRGGSTISMQVIRMAKDNPPRTIPQKLLEMLLALRLELSYSKDQILNLYAATLPTPLLAAMLSDWKRLLGAIMGVHPRNFPGAKPLHWLCCLMRPP